MRGIVIYLGTSEGKQHNFARALFRRKYKVSLCLSAVDATAKSPLCISFKLITVHCPLHFTLAPFFWVGAFVPFLCVFTCCCDALNFPPFLRNRLSPGSTSKQHILKIKRKFSDGVLNSFAEPNLLTENVTFQTNISHISTTAPTCSLPNLSTAAAFRFKRPWNSIKYRWKRFTLYLCREWSQPKKHSNTINKRCYKSSAAYFSTNLWVRAY